jgi:transposase
VEVAEYVPNGSPPGTLPTRVAVKRLKRGSALDAVDLAHEARVLKGLSHRHITKYVGVGASPSTRGKSREERERMAREEKGTRTAQERGGTEEFQALF